MVTNREDHQGAMPTAGPAGEKPGLATRTAWDWAGPLPYTCPRCGSAWRTPDLRPRCACGFTEGM